MKDILIVDDEVLQRDILKTILEAHGYRVSQAPDGNAAFELLKNNGFKLVLSDLKMPGLSGVELLEKMTVLPRKPVFIIMTAFGTIASAVDAIKKGAFDYVTKPLEKETILFKIRQAIDHSDLLEENRRLRDELYERFRIDGIIGSTDKLKEVIGTLKKVSPTGVPVLILGESGTGKELFARAIHYNSPRSKNPFTAINCAAIPETLLESELFGYEPGAFTGANTKKPGLFETTDGGTLFLDEIGDMPHGIQAKLLRIFQDGEVRRLGGRDSIRVDVRIIAATNRDIDQLVDEGNFRQDLYYRLRVVRIDLPPLRERKTDIPHLVRHFVSGFNEDYGKKIRGLDEQGMKLFMEYNWPGNIRQLASVIERAVIMADGDCIRKEDIAGELRIPNHKGPLDFDIPDEGIDIEELERTLLKKAMEKSNNVATRAAKLLGMSYKAFWYRWDKHGLGKGMPLE